MPSDYVDWQLLVGFWLDVTGASQFCFGLDLNLACQDLHSISGCVLAGI